MDMSALSSKPVMIVFPPPFDVLVLRTHVAL